MKFILNCIHITFFIAIFSCGSNEKAQHNFVVFSPDSLIVLHVGQSSDSAINSLEYSVFADGKEVVKPSHLGVITDAKNEERWTISAIDSSTFDETWESVLGKSKKISNRYNEKKLTLTSTDGKSMFLSFRAYDDGVAFRYSWPGKSDSTSIKILDEQTTFTIPGNPRVTALCFPNYTSSHETNYTVAPLNDFVVDTLIDLPALFEYDKNLFVAITEANLYDYPGMYLSKNSEGALLTKLSPLPLGNGVKAVIKGSHHSPWRVIMIGKTPGVLIESNIILNLSEPNVIEDVSWITPQKTTWHWWNNTVIPANASFTRGMNFETMKYYIDFAAQYGISCHSLTDVDSDSWYTSPKDTYPLPGPGTDVTKPNPKLRMDELLAYAKSKNVKLRLWVHWKSLEPQLEEAFTLYEKWGIEGLMVDYMDRDDQEMVNFYHKVMESAARHKLTIQFHGAYKPTGLRRTYPNLVTTEAVLNLEFLKWSDRCTPQHNVNAAFTRMLAGPLDYHMGGFNSVSPEKFVARQNRPMVMGTRSHILAMYVVFETYLQMLCDAPEAYINKPGFSFITTVPSTWDETKVLNASVGDYLIIARRHGESWYVGALNNTEPRIVEYSLSFLPEGRYTVEKYADPDKKNADPNEVIMTNNEISSTELQQIKMAGGGGFVMKLTKK